MKLFIITSFSKTIIDMALKERDSLIVTNNAALYSSLPKSTRTLFVGEDRKVDYSKSDKNFADLLMPGVLNGINIPGTEFPAWEAMSIDRFRFFYVNNGEKVRKFISSLNFDTVYISLDMGSVLPMIAMWVARDKKADCIAIKTEPIRTLEVFDLAPLFWFSKIIVDNEGEKEFLKRAGLRKRIKILTKGIEINLLAEFPSREGLKKSSAKKGKTLGIFFDKRDEWQVTNFLLSYVVQTRDYANFVIVPVDARSTALANTALPEFAKKFVTGTFSLPVCDDIVSFRWDDHYCLELPVPLKILDYRGVNRAALLAPEGVEVIEI